MRVAVRRAGVLLDAGSGTLVNARVTRRPADLDGSGILSVCVSEFPDLNETIPSYPDPVHAPWSRHVSAPGANTAIRIGRVAETYNILRVCCVVCRRFSTDPLSQYTLTLTESTIVRHVIWIMVHAPNSTLHAPINSKTQLSLRRRGCCACGVLARTSSPPRMTDGKNGGLGVVNLYTSLYTGFAGLCYDCVCGWGLGGRTLKSSPVC